jgi:hypothetical protein
MDFCHNAKTTDAARGAALMVRLSPPFRAATKLCSVPSRQSVPLTAASQKVLCCPYLL